MDKVRRYIGRWVLRADRHWQEVDPKRRKMLKYLGVGGVGFFMGKIFGPSLTWFNLTRPFDKEHFFDNFRVVESGDELGFYDKAGNQILVIEKDK